MRPVSRLSDLTDAQSRSEIITFKRFAEICPLNIVRESIDKREPPEPDIVCRLGGSEELVAFELVEILDEGWARLTSSQFGDADRLREAYGASTGEFRKALDRRLNNALVYVAFERAVSSRDRRASLPAILEELSRIEGDFTGEWRPRRGTALFDKVRIVGISRGGFEGPEFDVEAVGSIGDPTVERVQAKWQKSYRTACPIELLAYYELQPTLPDEMWLPHLTAFLEANWTTAPFRRIWLFDVGGKTIPYSGARPVEAVNGAV